jgi:hypothetical protein
MSLEVRPTSGAAQVFARPITTTPRGAWILVGQAPDQHELRITGRKPNDVITLASLVPSPDGFGATLSSMDLSALSGKRVRLTAQVRTDDVGTGAGFWARVDSQEGEVLDFENTVGADARTGSRGWEPVSIELDVAPGAGTLVFGSSLNGGGRIDLRDVRIEVIG